jgi:hypothetical protein
MLYHTMDSALEPQNLETFGYGKWDSFADHMEEMIVALSVGNFLLPRFSN